MLPIYRNAKELEKLKKAKIQDLYRYEKIYIHVLYLCTVYKTSPQFIHLFITVKKDLSLDYLYIIKLLFITLQTLRKTLKRI